MIHKIFQAVCFNLQSQLDVSAAQQMLQNPDSNLVPEEQVESQVKKNMLQEALWMSMGVLARLQTINDPHTDQAHAAARDLVDSLSKRLGIDADDRYGVPLKPR